MNIIGINAFHADAAAALIVDGQVITAVEEERFRRVKHWAGFPSEAIAHCLKELGAGLEAVDCIAINSDPKVARWRRLRHVLRHWPSPRLILEKLRTRQRRMGVREHLAQAFPGQAYRGRVEAVEHHLAHLASAFYPSGHARAAAVSIDGFGDFASGAWGLGEGAELRLDGHVWFPHSLGILYQALTQYLGFPNYGDEYKVMGLAPYGEPAYLDELRRLLRLDPQGAYELDLDCFRHHRESLSFEFPGGEPRFAALYSEELVRRLGPARRREDPLTQQHKDLARSVQVLFEEAAFALLRSVHQRYGVSALALAGGCAANSVANGKLSRETPFQDIYVAASSGDAGGAIGAALVAARRAGVQRFAPLHHAYLGTRYSNADCAAALSARAAELSAAGCRVSQLADEGELCRRVAARISEGAVVGWFQGRMEWGPRALGARSILGDPRRADMKDILNLKIKRRESFRPFAPSILREAVGEWFEVDADVPFMSLVFPIRAEQRARIPAVTHVDGSGRLQTVTAEQHPRYWRLIREFGALTGVPIVLNTSFNENEPIVCRPEEALDCFLRTQMDVLVLQDWLIERVEVSADGQERIL